MITTQLHHLSKCPFTCNMFILNAQNNVSKKGTNQAFTPKSTKVINMLILLGCVTSESLFTHAKLKSHVLSLQIVNNSLV